MRLKETCDLIKVWQSPEMIEIIRKWTPISVLIKPNNYNNYKNDKNNQTNV